MKKKTLIISIVSIIVLAIIIACIVFINPNNIFGKKDNSNNSNSNTSASNSDNNQKNDYPKSDEQVKSLFNSDFDIYLGSYTNGLRVKQLLTAITSNNEKNNGHKIEAVTNEGISIDFSKINNSRTYNVCFEYDKDGYIIKAIIKEN